MWWSPRATTRAPSCRASATTTGTCPTRWGGRSPRCGSYATTSSAASTRSSTSWRLSAPDERAADDATERVRRIDRAQRHDVTPAGPEPRRRDPAPREHAARSNPRDAEPTLDRERARLVVTLDHGDAAEAVITDAEACEHARADAPERDERDRRGLVALDG